MGLDDLEVEQGWGDDQAVTLGSVDWLKVAPGQAKEVIVLSPEPARYMGHWHIGTRRFHKCPPIRCRWCFQGLAKQRRFVLAVLDEHGRQWIWEFGAVHGGQVRALLRDGRELRGLSLVLMRPPGRGGNLPLSINLVAEAEGDGLFCRQALPEPADIAGLLWGVWSRQALQQGKAQDPITAPSARSSTAPSNSASSGPPTQKPSVEEVSQWLEQDRKSRSRR